MQEGLNLNVMLSSANLIALIGVFVKLYTSKQPRKIEPQPFEVKTATEHVMEKLCDDRHKDISEKQANLFARMTEAEKRIAAAEATLTSVDKRLESMDAKLDKLIAFKK